MLLLVLSLLRFLLLLSQKPSNSLLFLLLLLLFLLLLISETLKFGQKWVSNNRDIAGIEFVMGGWVVGGSGEWWDVQSHLQVKPNLILCYIELWLWLNWGFDNNKYPRTSIRYKVSDFKNQIK